MTLQIPEAKARLQAALRHWPSVDDCIILFILRLHWRVRMVVLLTHVDQLTIDQVSARMGVSLRTVKRDLSRAYRSYEEQFKGEFN